MFSSQWRHFNVDLGGGGGGGALFKCYKSHILYSKSHSFAYLFIAFYLIWQNWKWQQYWEGESESWKSYLPVIKSYCMVITCKTKSVLYTVAHWHKCPREIIQEFWASVHFSCFISQIMLKCRFSDFVYDLFTSVSVTKFHSYGRVKKRQKDFTVTDGVDCTWTFLAMAINEMDIFCFPWKLKCRFNLWAF